MEYQTYFSPDYFTARSRFLSLAQAANCRVESHPFQQQSPNGEDLTIDVAILGSENAKRTIVISSGLHGVEGFLGSAIQLAFLESHFAKELRTDLSFVLIHALNPYGFVHLRRWDEENIDLNRNFLLSGEDYKGSPALYPQLDAFFNPPYPPSRFEPYWLKAIALILRYGIKALKETLPVGQYDYPKGLFFGGQAHAQTQRILELNLSRWIGKAESVCHVDFHTGYGRWGDYILFTGKIDRPEKAGALAVQFGSDKLEIWSTEGISYPMNGDLGAWCKAKFPDCDYDFLTAEFGTYPTLKVVKMLRAENQVFWYAKSEDRNFGEALKEIFAPADRNWRDRTVSQGMDIIQRAIA
ncbi:DUF2817 domain-containing protein [Tumidithrix elongata RA019]|uniref:DUF2817 domain-containing protein n=1 Tax=Tumidithrix elongata BACA0141 TaxID=2716417 RepID=A0AAW9PYT2_9CYAN|nr:DUF2817 domain-containing protein [Tumidithrix elongata RA019]